LRVVSCAALQRFHDVRSTSPWAVRESVEISPDGQMLAAVLMNGSNLAAEVPLHSGQSGLDSLVRRGKPV
jgi:hypothetical protein